MLDRGPWQDFCNGTRDAIQRAIDPPVPTDFARTKGVSRRACPRKSTRKNVGQSSAPPTLFPIGRSSSNPQKEQTRFWVSNWPLETPERMVQVHRVPPGANRRPRHSPRRPKAQGSGRSQPRRPLTPIASETSLLGFLLLRRLVRLEHLKRHAIDVEVELR